MPFTSHDTDGLVSTLAGSSEPGEIDGPVASARFTTPMGVVFDTFGNAFVNDLLGHRIRKIGPDGIVSTLAGSEAGFRDGWGTNALFDHPFGLAIDSNNNLYPTFRSSGT
ncbi:MAG: hypothetical protein M1608_01095 [Candidatus Omnitrophica bacterium]|nr:hypothetical protein [Candidatus Omnitrophota bacterium]